MFLRTSAPWLLRGMGVALFVLVLFDVTAANGRLLPVIVVLAVAYIGALIYFGVAGREREVIEAIEPGDIALLRYLMANGPCTERQLMDAADRDVGESEIFDWAKRAEGRGLVTLLSNGHWQITDAARRNLPSA